MSITTLHGFNQYILQVFAAASLANIEERTKSQIPYPEGTEKVPLKLEKKE